MEAANIQLSERYQLLRELGRGGFASVFLAHDRLLDQPVAVKVLRLKEISQTDQERFLREARIGARLRHAHIVTVFDILQTSAGLQLIMEYYPGGNLSEYIARQGPLPTHEALDFARQIARALDYAHAHQVIHRDVKPANIFLAADGTVKLGDFGTAAHAGQHEFTQTGTIIGTPIYMPPEQSLDSRDVDAGSDIYALGLTLYHMLAGTPPRIIDLEAVPAPFRKLIRLATAANRNERLGSARQFIAHLDQIATSLSEARPASPELDRTVATPPPRPPQPRLTPPPIPAIKPVPAAPPRPKRMRRSRKFLLLLGGIVLLIWLNPCSESHLGSGRKEPETKGKVLVSQTGHELKLTSDETLALARALQDYFKENAELRQSLQAVLAKRATASGIAGEQTTQTLARKRIEAALLKSPNDPILNLIYALVNLKEGDTDGGMTYLNKAAELDRRQGGRLRLTSRHIGAIREEKNLEQYLDSGTKQSKSQ